MDRGLILTNQISGAAPRSVDLELPNHCSLWLYDRRKYTDWRWHVGGDKTNYVDEFHLYSLAHGAFDVGLFSPAFLGP